MTDTVISRATAWALARRPVRAYLRYAGARGPVLADSVTYRTLFSLFAGVLLGFSFAGIWLAGNPDALSALTRSLNSAIPGLVGENGLIDVSKIEAPGAFTIAGIVSLLGLVGAAIGAIGTLRTALRQIAAQTTDDTFIAWVLLRNLALAIGIGGSLAAAAAATFLATAGLDVLRGWLGVAADAGWAGFLAWFVSVVVVLALDTVVVAALFAFLSGLRVRRRTLWKGALLGGVGLTVLQQLSGLFVGGASSNPLLGTFASLIALLLWLNLSSQVILIASAYIVTGHEEDEDRVHARFGAATMVQFRVRQAERAVQAAASELTAARDAEATEREKSAASGDAADASHQ
ncbi:membrane protein [Microbacterium sp. AG1240]|uniref:YihY/virulence factor BrkB family protein n=1 Tax=Microbacterium sp. AG1240 TaxID=2183992 RepID=UPI000EACC7D4|nr:YihY/virulence factor BrkB family protein [Microbacterium sp. AG1240]RKT31129.1 membrane protein [Microbacterium sp. AG1240]